MSKRENDANNIFRPSDRPLTEYEEEQKALRKNLERLRAERLAREAAKSKEAQTLRDASMPRLAGAAFPTHPRRPMQGNVPGKPTYQPPLHLESSCCSCT